MRAELGELLRDARDDDAVGAIVLTGTGRGFCAGQDFAETRGFRSSDPGRVEKWMDRINNFYDLIRSIDKPTVAAVNGVAAGSGFQVTLLMDVRVAHESAALGQPEVSSGIPSITGTYLMATYLGMSRTTEMVLSGRLMTAQEAHAAGVVHSVIADGNVLDAAITIADQLAAQPAGAIARTKEWLRNMTEEGYRAAFSHAKNSHRNAYATGEPQKMMARFLDRSSNQAAAQK